MCSLCDVVHYYFIQISHFFDFFFFFFFKQKTAYEIYQCDWSSDVCSSDLSIAKKVNSAIFPGIQGGPFMHIIAAKAVAFHEALQPSFKLYSQAVVENARVLGEALIAGGLDLVSGGTDTHLLLVDLRPKGLTGRDGEAALGRANITCNKNGVPFDPEKPMVTSGIRLGSPAGTTRGFGVSEFRGVGEMILEVLDGVVANGADSNSEIESGVKAKVIELCARYPVYASGA